MIITNKLNRRRQCCRSECLEKANIWFLDVYQGRLCELYRRSRDVHHCHHHHPDHDERASSVSKSDYQRTWAGIADLRSSQRIARNIHHRFRYHRRVCRHIHGVAQTSLERLFCAEAEFPQACDRMFVLHIKPLCHIISLTPILAVLAPFRDLSKRRSMAALLISFTIYTDTTYAISSVTSQLFILEVYPGTLEISLYALASTISGVVCSVGFMALRPHIPIRLETWLLIGYGIMILIPVWGAIGFANVSFGFKVSFHIIEGILSMRTLPATAIHHTVLVSPLLTEFSF
jgi:hypothetical protein